MRSHSLKEPQFYQQGERSLQYFSQKSEKPTHPPLRKNDE